jgi:hypothetical protein
MDNKTVKKAKNQIHDAILTLVHQGLSETEIRNFINAIFIIWKQQYAKSKEAQDLIAQREVARAEAAMERGISMAETDFEEDSEYGLAHRTGIREEVEREQLEREQGYGRIDAWDDEPDRTEDYAAHYDGLAEANEIPPEEQEEYERKLRKLQDLEDGYGADDPSKFDDFGPEDAEVGERLLKKEESE